MQRNPSSVSKIFLMGVGFVGFGVLLAGFCYFILQSIPLTALGIAFSILGCVLMIFPEYLVPHRVVKGMISGATANIEAILEEFAAVHKAVYFPLPDGKIYAFIPLSQNPYYPEVEKLSRFPRRLIASLDGHPGLFVYPPGSDIIMLADIMGEESLKKENKNSPFSWDNFLPQLENAISYLLVDFSELASSVRTSFEGKKVFVDIKNVKFDVEAPRYKKILGSPPASIACCIVAAFTGKAVKALEEKEEGKWRKVVLEVQANG